MSTNPTQAVNSIAYQLSFIRDSLSDWAKQLGGKVIIAKDYHNMWEVASNNPGPKAICVFDGEDIRGPFETAAATGRVDRRYAVLVSRGEGFTAHRADTLTEETSTAAFFELLEQARDIIRTLLFDPSVTEAMEGDPVDYKGIESVSVDGYPIDAYIIRFSIGTQLGVVKTNFNWIITGPPNPPTNLNLVDNGSSVTLHFTINSPDITTSTIQRSGDGVSYSTIATVNGLQNNYTDSTVSISTTYWYKVFSTSVNGNSGPSNIATIFV